MRAFSINKKWALLGWGLVNTLLVLSIGRELGWGEVPDQALSMPIMHPIAQANVMLLPDYRLPGLKHGYAGTLKRPLFVPSRREAPPVPPVPPPPPPPPPTMQKGQFQLMGTIITDEMRTAIVKEVSSGKERQVVQGYTINGLQLELVEASHIVFTQYDDREEIRLKLQRSPKPAPTPTLTPQTGQAGGQHIVPAASKQPGGWPAAAGQAAAGAAGVMPPRAPQAAQTMEDRKNNPLLKDFYK